MSGRIGSTATPDEAVVDSSVIIALVTLEERSDWAEHAMSIHGYFHVLDLTYYEVANAIRHKTSDRFRAKDARDAFSEAVKLMDLFALHDFSEIIDDALAMALALNITIYDAAFLSLAKKLGVRFLTLDEKLAKKLEGTAYHKLLECPNK